MSKPDISPASVRLIAVLLAVAFWIFVIGSLAGCGGGGDDDSPDQSIGPPDCRARPELCQ